MSVDFFTRSGNKKHVRCKLTFTHLFFPLSAGCISLMTRSGLDLHSWWALAHARTCVVIVSCAVTRALRDPRHLGNGVDRPLYLSLWQLPFHVTHYTLSNPLLTKWNSFSWQGTPLPQNPFKFGSTGLVWKNLGVFIQTFCGKPRKLSMKVMGLHFSAFKFFTGCPSGFDHLSLNTITRTSTDRAVRITLSSSRPCTYFPSASL